MEKLKDCICCKDWSRQQIHALVSELDRIAGPPVTTHQVLVRGDFYKKALPLRKRIRSRQSSQGKEQRLESPLRSGHI